MTDQIKVEVIVNEPIDKAWACYTDASHITKWNHADDSWHSPRARNDLRDGGTFNYRMEAKDGSEGFDFEGTYDKVVPRKLIRYHMSDGRAVSIAFAEMGNSTHVEVNFDPENENPIDMQKGGWQSILNNYKSHTEDC